MLSVRDANREMPWSYALLSRDSGQKCLYLLLEARMTSQNPTFSWGLWSRASMCPVNTCKGLQPRECGLSLSSLWSLTIPRPLGATEGVWAVKKFKNNLWKDICYLMICKDASEVLLGEKGRSENSMSHFYNTHTHIHVHVVTEVISEWQNSSYGWVSSYISCSVFCNFSTMVWNPKVGFLKGEKKFYKFRVLDLGPKANVTFDGLSRAPAGRTSRICSCEDFSKFKHESWHPTCWVIHRNLVIEVINLVTASAVYSSAHDTFQSPTWPVLPLQIRCLNLSWKGNCRS